jgi:hypothetical protein
MGLQGRLSAVSTLDQCTRGEASCLLPSTAVHIIESHQMSPSPPDRARHHHRRRRRHRHHHHPHLRDTGWRSPLGWRGCPARAAGTVRCTELPGARCRHTLLTEGAPPSNGRATNLVQDARQQVLQALGLRVARDDVRVGRDGGLDWPHKANRRLRCQSSRRARRRVGGLTLRVAEVDNAAVVLHSMSGLSEARAAAARPSVALSHLEEVHLFDPRNRVDTKPLQGVLEPLVICRAAAA